MSAPVVILKFEGKETINELYQITVASLKDLMRVTTALDAYTAEKLRLILMEYVAICTNAAAKKGKV